MSISSVSFWQQDANYWNKSVARDQSLSQTTALINVMGSAMTNLTTGLASIANQTALDRVNTALTAAVQNALQQTSGGSTASSSSGSGTTPGSSGSSGSSSPPAPVSFPIYAPANGTGKVPLAASTSLLTLGIPATGSISVSDGNNTTTYTSTGSDTVGDLVNAINANTAGNASVSAFFNNIGQLVVASQDNTDMITVGGNYASAVGFGPGNNTFTPTNLAASSSSAGSSGSSTSSATSSSAAASASSALSALLSGGTSTGSSTSGTSSSSSSSSTSSAGATGSSSKIANNSAAALLSGGTAEILLASSGSTGTLLDMLA